MDVRVWVLPRRRRFVNLGVLVVVTIMFSIGLWTTWRDGVGWFGTLWLALVAVVLPWTLVAALRLADRVELHPEGTLLLSGPARVMHTHVHRVRRLKRRRWGEGWVWVLHTDDGRVAMDADLPEIGALLDVLRRAGADVPG